MPDITQNFTDLYTPVSALICYKGRNGQGYMEHFDIEEDGNLANAHPLTVEEAATLSLILKPRKDEQEKFLSMEGIVPLNLISLTPGKAAMWYVPAKKRMLLFKDNLGLESALGGVPAMVFCADRKELKVFALEADMRPDENSKLYHAPFFNINTSGRVCMGTVNVKFNKNTSLNEFMSKWEEFFFNSYFTHLMGDHNPIEGNLVSLWKELLGTDSEFPVKQLRYTGTTIKRILR